MINEKIDKILQTEYAVGSGLNYLMPNSWWQEFCFLNFGVTDIQNLLYPEMITEHFVETFLFDFQGSIIDELSAKSNYLGFNRILISPEIKKYVEWRAVSPKLWKKIAKSKKNIRPVLTITNSHNLQETLSQNFIQFQIVYCSKSGSEAFIGFLPENLVMVDVVRKIGFEMGFIQMENSRITFPDKVAATTYLFHEYDKITLNEAADTIVMAFNLERNVEESKEKDFSFNKGPDMMNSSNEALAGDLGMIANDSWSQLQNERTLSTGAETPFFSFSRSQRGEEIRVREIFRDKKPEQIEQMKMQAQNAINSQLILIPKAVENEGQLEKQLFKLSEEIVEQIQVHKKKVYKEKEPIQ